MFEELVCGYFIFGLELSFKGYTVVRILFAVFFCEN